MNHIELQFRHCPEGYLKYLPAVRPPKPGELFSSWLVRTAHQHGLKIHSFTKILWPEVEFWNRDIDFNPNFSVLKSLSEITCASIEQILETTLRSYQDILYQAKTNSTSCAHWILPMSKYHRFIHNKAILFCPECLSKDREDPFFRKTWRLAFSTCCPECNIQLLDQCPECGKPIMFFRNELGKKTSQSDRPISFCYNCGFNLTTSERIVASAQELSIQQRLYSIMKEGYCSNVIYPILFFDVLHFLVKLLAGNLTLSQNIRDVITEKTYCNLIDFSFERRIRFEALPLHVRRLVITMAFWLLDDWPHRFISVFTSRIKHGSELLRDLKNPPYWYKKVVADHFYQLTASQRSKCEIGHIDL